MLTNILFENAELYTCGNGGLTFEGIFPTIVSTVITIIKIAVPILLIILGMLDLGKAITAQKDDEIKKGQQTFIKRLIAAALVFFVIFIVQIVVRFVAKGDNSNISTCINCFINGNGGETYNKADAANGGGCWKAKK